MTQETIIDDVHVNAATGHITVWVHVHTKQDNVEWDGPGRGYGCDAVMFQSMFGGDIGQFESWIFSQHSSLMGVHLEFVDRLMERKGKAIKPVQNLDPE